MSNDLVKELALRYCVQENEIWEETSVENRRRFLQEARATLAELKGDNADE